MWIPTIKWYLPHTSLFLSSNTRILPSGSFSLGEFTVTLVLVKDPNKEALVGDAVTAGCQGHVGALLVGSG